jgi:hypothetical protein
MKRLEKIEDIKEVIRRFNLKRDRQYDGKTKNNEMTRIL